MMDRNRNKAQEFSKKFTEQLAHARDNAELQEALAGMAQALQFALGRTSSIDPSLIPHAFSLGVIMQAVAADLLGEENSYFVTRKLSEGFRGLMHDHQPDQEIQVISNPR